MVWVTSDENIASESVYELWTPFRRIYGQDPMWIRGWRYARGYWQLVRRAIAEARKAPWSYHFINNSVTFPALGILVHAGSPTGGVAWV